MGGGVGTHVAWTTFFIAWTIIDTGLASCQARDVQFRPYARVDVWVGNRRACVPHVYFICSIFYFLFFIRGRVFKTSNIVNVWEARVKRAE